MYALELNEKCFWWTNNWLCNTSFVTQTIWNLEDLIAHRGYLYISEIYNVFGAEWDPKKPNEVILEDEVGCDAALFSMLADEEKNRIIIHVEI